tara:strand:- start:102 stop:656 length:555 start_codon:yes stop_codon:yes gene_type:complete
MRAIEDRNILDHFCIEFCNIVEKHCKYIIVSGFLVISSGRTRATEDIDMIVEKLSFEVFNKLHTDLTKSGFVCVQEENPNEIYKYLIDKTSVRYTRRDEPLPEMEIKFSKDILDELQIKKRKKIPLTGLDIWFSSIEMNIAFKEELLKSEKDLKDAEHLRKVFSESIKEKEVEGIKTLIRNLRL